MSRTIITVLACVVFLASVAVADPAAPGVLGKQGEFGLGIVGGHSERQFELGNRPTVISEVKYTQVFPGPRTVSTSTRTTITHLNARLQSDYVFLVPKYAVHDKVDVYVKLGGARQELTLRNQHTYSTTTLNNGTVLRSSVLDTSGGNMRDDQEVRPALGIGTTAQLFGTDKVKVLADAQYTHHWLGTYEDTYVNQGGMRGSTRMRLSNGHLDTIQISLPVALTLDKFTIFAGPRYTWARAKYDVRVKTRIDAAGWTGTSTPDELQLKQNEPWGVFGGVAYQITEKIAAMLFIGGGDAWEGNLAVVIGL